MKRHIYAILFGCCTALVLSGCGDDKDAEVKTQEVATTPETIEVEPLAVTPDPITSYTVSFEESGNESIETKDGEEIVIPEYQGIKLLDMYDFSLITTDDEGYYCVDNDRVCSSDNAKTDEDTKTVSLKNVKIPYEVRYVVNSEDDIAYPVKLIQKEEPVNSGICVSLEYEDMEDGTKAYTFKGITDLFGRPIDNAEIYRGEFKGWAAEQTADDAEYLSGSNAVISQNLTLYPIFNKEGIDILKVADGTEFKAITDDTKGIVATIKWGNISVNDKGNLITDNDNSIINQENGIVADATTAKAETTQSNSGESAQQQTGAGKHDASYYAKNIQVPVVNAHGEIIRYEYVSQADVDLNETGNGTNPYAGTAIDGIPYTEVTQEDEERFYQEWVDAGCPVFNVE